MSVVEISDLTVKSTADAADKIPVRDSISGEDKSMALSTVVQALPVATSGAKGVMSASDKVILDGVAAKLDISVQLKIWANSEAYELVSATYNAEGVVTSASVKWPDGGAGTFTATTINTTFNAIDAYTLTHTNSSKTVTQSTVTRDINGNITTKPEISIA